MSKDNRKEFPWCFMFEGKWYFAKDDAKQELEGLGINVIPR